MVAVAWTGDIGIFEDCACMDAAASWIAEDTNRGLPHHVTEGIDLTDCGTEGTNYILPIITKIGFVEDPDIKITKLAGRINFRISTGAGGVTITMTCLCIDDSTSSAETKINNILGFIRRHDKMSDTAIYLVISRLLNSSREYIKFQLPDTDSEYATTYLQCSVTSGKPKWVSYGFWTINIQCEEVNT